MPGDCPAMETSRPCLVMFISSPEMSLEGPWGNERTRAQGWCQAWGRQPQGGRAGPSPHCPFSQDHAAPRALQTHTPYRPAALIAAPCLSKGLLRCSLGGRLWEH